MVSFNVKHHFIVLLENVHCILLQKLLSVLDSICQQSTKCSVEDIQDFGQGEFKCESWFSIGLRMSHQVYLLAVIQGLHQISQIATSLDVKIMASTWKSISRYGSLLERVLELTMSLSHWTNCLAIMQQFDNFESLYWVIFHSETLS